MASTTPPSINKSTTSGSFGTSDTTDTLSNTTAVANKVTRPNPQSTNSNLTVSASDIYPYKIATNLNNHYKNYNFKNMAKEQVGKLKTPLLRFSLICNGYKFQAHIDPNHIVNNQMKRIVQLDTLTGIVLQDYGYGAQSLELRGTTGAAFYVEIDKLNTVFNNQSTNAAPTPCQLILEGITYQGVWKEFTYERQSQDNIYKYTIGFTVMSIGKISSSNNTSSAVIAAKKTANALTISNGKNKVNIMPWAGRTPAAFVAATSSIPANQRNAALSFLNANWKTATVNKRSYPGDNATLLSNEMLVVPLSWANVLNSNVGAVGPSSPGISGGV